VSACIRESVGRFIMFLAVFWKVLFGQLPEDEAQEALGDKRADIHGGLCIEKLVS
jgi:hypothetical protein